MESPGVNASRFALACSPAPKLVSEMFENPNAPGSWHCRKLKPIPAQLASLLAMARTDKRDVREVLWMIAEREPENLAARQELYQAYWQERNADGMLRMMELVLRERPDDRAAKYNVAALLLVYRTRDRSRRPPGKRALRGRPDEPEQRCHPRL